eukprot:RCo031369
MGPEGSGGAAGGPAPPSAMGLPESPLEVDGPGSGGSSRAGTGNEGGGRTGAEAMEEEHDALQAAAWVCSSKSTAEASGVKKAGGSALGLELFHNGLGKQYRAGDVPQPPPGKSREVQRQRKHGDVACRKAGQSQ